MPKLVIALVTILFSTVSATVHATSMASRPFRIEVTLVKNDFKVDFKTNATLICEATRRCPWDCPTEDVRKELKVSTTLLSETNEDSRFMIEYNNHDRLVNPFGANYRNKMCYVKMVLEIKDPVYKGDAWAVYTTQKFDDIHELHNLSFTYHYDWRRYEEEGMYCFGNPVVCLKFLHLQPVVSPANLKENLVSGETAQSFPKPE